MADHKASILMGATFVIFTITIGKAQDATAPLPLLFGLTYQLTGSYRDAILSLVGFFVLGFVLLARVPVRRAIADAGNPVPQRI